MRSQVSMPLGVLLVLAAALLLPAHGCKKGGSAKGGRSAKGKTPPRMPKLKIRADSKKLRFTWRDAKGDYQTTDRVAKVPKGRRAAVVVTDLSLSPEERRAASLIFLADLRTPRKDGTYRYTTVSRYRFEEQADQGGTPAARPTAGPVAADAGTARARPPRAPPARAAGPIVLYSTSWCPACRALRSYLVRKGVRFVEKDIEKDPAAKAELLRKAARAGVRVRGVPVTDLRGTIVVGFDPRRIGRLLGGR